MSSVFVISATKKTDKENNRLWSLVKRQTDCLSQKTAQSIVDYAVYYSADVIVMEHLDTSKKNRGANKQKIHHLRHKAIWNMVISKAHFLSIRVASINAWGTSRLAYDGSGRVSRGKEAELPYSMCKFANGKVYNCDLNASYNIGARYLIRQILKPLSVRTRSEVEAKVPQLTVRSTCTLSDLISLNRALGGVYIVKTAG